MLVVGASASGAQIADELARAGRRVVLAVGSHTRVPRRYRGLDVHWWLDQTGRHGPHHRHRATDPVAARREPSFQLAGPRAPRRARRRRRPEHPAGRGRRGDRTAAHEPRPPGRVRRRPGRHRPAGRRPAGPVPRHRGRPRREHPPHRRGRPRRPAGAGADRPPAAPPRPPRRGHRDGAARHRVRPAPPVAEGPGRRTGRVPPARSAAPPRRRVCTSSASASSTAATRRRSTAPGTTPTTSSPTSAGTTAWPCAPWSSDELAPTYDVVVVGGRVAGASTAMLLARAGARVLVLDRSAYGSDTLSTHGLMRAGVLQLTRWGLLDPVVAAGTPAVRSTTFRFAGDEPIRVTIRPHAGVEALYAPRRHVLDRILADAAAAAGAELRHGVRVTGLLRDRSGRVAGVRTLDEAGRDASVTASYVVGADGIRSVVADAAGAPVVRRGRYASAVRYAYFEGLDAPGYEMGVRRRGGGRADPHQRRAALRVRRDHARADADAAAGQPGRRRLRRDLAAGRARPARPAAPTPAGSAASTAGPGRPATCAGRGGRAGRWWATRATSRTRSARTG